MALNVSDLNPAQRSRVEEITEELNRRKREERCRYFKPTHPGIAGHKGFPANDQKGFFLDPSPERWIFGGNRSGKTEMLVYDCNEFATGRHPIRSVNHKPPVNIRMCAPPTTKDGQVGIVIEKLKQMVIRDDLLGGSWERAYSPSERVLYYNDGRKPNNKGSYIQFKSSEQSVDKYAGWMGDAVYTDEHYHISYYRENQARLVDHSGYYVHTMTPEAGAITWERKHVFNNENSHFIAYWKFSQYGNPYLPLEAIEKFEASITDERIRRVKVHGEFVPLSGLIYENFHEQMSFIKFDELPEEWPRICILDPHIKKEHAIIWAALSPEKEFWVYRTKKIHATPEDLKRYIRTKSIGENIVAWVADEAMGGGRVDNFGNLSILEILRQGDNSIPFVGTQQKGDGQFQAGVMRVRQWLEVDNITGKPRILINKPDCQELVDELNEYQFMPETAADELTFRQRVRHVFDDEVTCLRYGIGWAETYILGWGAPIESALEGAWL